LKPEIMNYMKVNGKDYRTVWMLGNSVFMIDQNLLPFKFKIYEAKIYSDCCSAIKNMTVRGAGAIGAAAGYAMAQAFLEAPKRGFERFVAKAKADIENTRPTARNLFYAVERVYIAGMISTVNAVKEAKLVADEDAEASLKIGIYGNEIIKDGYRIETHCNAGWLAFVDYGTVSSPIYTAHKEGKKIFVYVDETRPRGQGARLTAWEFYNENIPHTIIADNSGAFLMSQGKVNLMIVGADRIAANGDVANKIGTFEKAIISKELNIPFYVAAPTSTFDRDCKSGDDIIIEERSEEEGLYQTGLTDNGNIERIKVCSPGSHYYNPAFDVTPARYIRGVITEKGIFKPEELINLTS
jgi:methylthioribose-1-phosphate isomerase